MDHIELDFYFIIFIGKDLMRNNILLIYICNYIF